MLIAKTLSRDHRALEQLLDELGAIASTEPQQRLEVFTRLQGLLQAHARAEEEVVYRALRQAAPEEAQPLLAYEEHHVADLLLQELASAAPGHAEWVAKARVLEEALRQHIKQEEITLFALLDEHFDKAAQAAMDKEFRAVKHQRLETLLGPLRRAMPAFAGRAVLPAQVLAAQLMRRGELYLRRRRGSWRQGSGAAGG